MIIYYLYSTMTHNAGRSRRLLKKKVYIYIIYVYYTLYISLVSEPLTADFVLKVDEEYSTIKIYAVERIVSLFCRNLVFKTTIWYIM